MKNKELLIRWNSEAGAFRNIGFCSLPFDENSKEVSLITEASVAQFGGWKDWRWPGNRLSAIQSLFYGINITNMYSEKDLFFNHIDLVGQFLRKNGIRYAVFGSPKLRKTSSLGDELLFVEMWQKIADIYLDIIWGIEINPDQYGTNICTTYHNTLDIVKSINRKNVVLHFDTGCVEMSGENPEELLVDHILGFDCYRIHISEPNLVEYSGNYERIIDICIQNEIGFSLEQLNCTEESNQLFINQTAKAIKSKLKI